MTFTFFLLGLVYVVLIVALLGAGANGITVAVIAGGLALFQLFGADKLARGGPGARVGAGCGAGIAGCTDPVLFVIQTEAVSLSSQRFTHEYNSQRFVTTRSPCVA
jgi:hypothetical protein